MIGNSPPLRILTRLLEVANLRQEVIAQNVANVNSPGFQTLEVQFEEAFAKSLSSNKLENALTVQPVVGPGGGGIARLDGNDVDMDAEMARLSKNLVLFKTYTQIMNMQLAQYRSAIQGR